MTAPVRFVRCGGVVLAAAIAAAGCGGHHPARFTTRPRPKLPQALAVQLAAASADVARKLDAGDACGALAAARSLQRRTIEAINGGSVPRPLQEPLQATVTDLAARIGCTPPPVSPALPPRGKKRGHGHQNHGKHKGHDGGEGD
jgi:hypothetical protein